jgi:hypothetical protein
MGGDFADQINVLYDVAKENGSPLSVEQVLSLLPDELSPERLEEVLLSTPGLNERFEIKSGLIFERQTHSNEQISSVNAYLESEGRSRRNFGWARQFVTLARYTPSEMISVSGSNSYFSASTSDDIDLFCVTEADSLWLFVTKSLLLARLFRWTRSGSPPLCFSCVMDSRYAELMFSRPQDALFARDALTARVVHGSGIYGSLLQKSTWMGNYFKRPYSSRLSLFMPLPGDFSRKTKSTRKLTNLFMYSVVGSYIRVKSFLLNRRLSKQNKSAIFLAKLGPDHLIYESRRYLNLRSLYSQIRQDTKDESSPLQLGS